MATPPPGPVDLYGAQYTNFATDLYARIRTAAVGQGVSQDIGQNGWLTADEQDVFLDWLELEPASRVLDVACGSGGPTLRIAASRGCRVSGIDIHAEGIAQARRYAAERGLADRAEFLVTDGGAALPFEDDAFDAITCIDAINHLPDRAAVLGEWRRVLRPGGRLLYTDPIIVTGPLTGEEIAVRASIGFFLFVPPGLNEALLARCGFDVHRADDRTENMAAIAHRWHEARAAHESELCRIEGDARYHGQQRFLEVAALLARERRLSRFAFLAVKPG